MSCRQRTFEKETGGIIKALESTGFDAVLNAVKNGRVDVRINDQSAKHPAIVPTVAVKVYGPGNEVCIRFECALEFAKMFDNAKAQKKKSVSL